MAHIRAMRWYILNRLVTGRAVNTLTLNHDASCWGGSCQDWGYWLNNHLTTLDHEGEWFCDAATERLYVYTSTGAPEPGSVEASVVLHDDDRSWGGINLGRDLLAGGISHVIVENFAIQRWWRHGISTPTNHAHTENHHIIVRDNTITDVDSTGINLAAWVWGAEDGRPDGWRGGYAMTISGNVLYSLQDKAWTLRPSEIEMLSASDCNYFFHPYEEKQIAVGGWSGRLSLAEWKTASGLDGASKKNWFSLDEGEAPRSRVFYNDTSATASIELGRCAYLDLDQNAILGSTSLPPYRSVVLIDDGPAPLSLTSLSPNLFAANEATSLTLTLRGAGFTVNSVARWRGSDRTPSYVNSPWLAATIPAADVSTVGDFAVTIYDPAPLPGGTETLSLTFGVVESVFRRYLPLALK